MRRYLFSGNISELDIFKYDVLVIGSGIAGLYSALHIDANKTVGLITKVGIDESNSWLAQGGIAAVMSKEDRSELHIADTLKAGAGLCDEEAVRVLVNEGPENIRALVDMDVPFDLNSEGELAITREGGHRMRRIVHCGGDATGRETTKRLGEIVMLRDNIQPYFHTILVDILTDDSGVWGAICYNLVQQKYMLFVSGNIILATGGIGQIYNYTTNPVGAVGDGIACALRAGARVTNMEMIQFHPTTLIPYGASPRLFLISEAVRGEGGVLRNKKGEQFMKGRHEMAELAPRDIVTRGILAELRESGDSNVFLDVSSMDKEFFSHRFPTIYAECTKHGINLPGEPIPVRPAQHYLMGGVKTNLDGMTDLTGLYACGEVANTGIHGANRLASNSMLECLVFGRRSALHINNNFRSVPEVYDLEAVKRNITAQISVSQIKVEQDKQKIKDIMTNNLGAIRHTADMQNAKKDLLTLWKEYDNIICDTPEKLELVNMFEVSYKVICDALARKESVGAHYIED
ncbi:MAG: L-aspartate oxidase [Ruminococcaceae bacterium]|nr:L-aspartate oxidase [Oscillospiraceae bacterium]